MNGVKDVDGTVETNKVLTGEAEVQRCRLWQGVFVQGLDKVIQKSARRNNRTR